MTIAEAASPPLPALDREAALFLDVDGTLLEIAPRPDEVRVPAGLPDLLERRAGERGGALALVSGRALADIDALFRPWQGAAAGLHGLERRRADLSLDRALDPEAAGALDRLRPQFALLARRIRGLLVEDKGATIALHYRAVPERAAEVIAAVESLRHPALREILGKMVIEFQPRIRNKGAAVAAFLAEPPFIGRLPVYLGDDTTDEDAFAEINRRGGVSVLVGPARATAAMRRLPSVASVLDWLFASDGC